MTLHKGENPYIYGLHDPGGEHVMKDGGTAKGWVLVTEAIGAEANDRGGGDYRGITDQGMGLIVRLNQSYGPNGTIPREKRYPEFAQRCANFAEDSKGAHIWLIGNEMNFEREQPRQEGSDKAEIITPRRYAECYKMVRNKIKAVPGHENDLVVTGSPAPWNAQTKYEADPKGKYPANPNGDWVNYLRDILLAIGPNDIDAISIHTYSHGYKADMVFNEAKMGAPFEHRYYNFYAYKDQMNAIPENMRHLPVYLTEMNGDREGGHDGPTWPYGNNGWIKNAYKEINNWNKSGQQQIRCGILFRWKIDPLGWSIDGKGDVQQDLREAVAQNYKWDPNAGKAKPAAKPKPKPKPETKPVTPTSTPVVPAQPSKPGYAAEYLKHNTPTSMSAGQNITVNLTVKNEGSFKWVRGGSQPFQLGFQWYDANGQFVTLPSTLDFRTPLPRTVMSGAQVDLQAKLRTPDKPGNYQLRWDMVHEQVTWFASQGDPGLIVSVSVTATAPASKPSKPATKPPATPKVPITIEAEDVSESLAHHATKQYPMRTHADIKRIIIHHTATPASVTVERIAAFQVNNKGLPGIAYHYCVTDDGKVYQTQYLETVAAHAGQNSADSVGVCLIGNFTSVKPPKPQLDATASLLSQLAMHLGLSADSIVGYSEIVTTGSPGATWPQWKKPMMTKVKRAITIGKPVAMPKPKPQPKPQPTATPVSQKAIDHYMLFWYRNANSWAKWDLQGAFDYIARFKPVVGFDVEQAKLAKNVTIVGGTGGVSAKAEQVLRAAGCKVDRLDGQTEAGTRQLLQELAAKGRRYRKLK